MQTFSTLKGLKVLDLSTVLAGPSVGTFLAELGAQVVKIESPKGDVTRTWYSANEDRNTTSAYFLSVNANKEIIQLDLLTQRNELETYLANCDLLLLNFKKSDETKFNLVPSDLILKYPKLIIGKIKGFETEDHRVAYDVAIQAETGYMSINGEVGSTPLKMPVAFMDVLAAHQLKEGLLCALIERSKTGLGQIVECSLESAGIVSLMNQGSNYLKTHQSPKASGSLHPSIAPYGEQIVFKDNIRIVLAIGSDKQFGALCSILNCEDLIIDQRFCDNPSRVVHREKLQKLLKERASQIHYKEIRNSLIHLNVPFGEIKGIDQVLATPLAKEKIVIDNKGNQSVRHIGFSFLR